MSTSPRIKPHLANIAQYNKDLDQLLNQVHQAYLACLTNDEKATVLDQLMLVFPTIREEHDRTIIRT